MIRIVVTVLTGAQEEPFGRYALSYYLLPVSEEKLRRGREKSLDWAKSHPPDSSKGARLTPLKGVR